MAVPPLPEPASLWLCRTERSAAPSARSHRGGPAARGTRRRRRTGELSSPLSARLRASAWCSLCSETPRPRPAGPPSRSTAPLGTCPRSQGGCSSPPADVAEAGPCPLRQPPTTPLFSRIHQLLICKLTFPVTFHRTSPMSQSTLAWNLSLRCGPPSITCAGPRSSISGSEEQHLRPRRTC